MQKAEDLKFARLLVGLSQSEAAERIGVSREHYCRMEKGKAAISEVRYITFLDSIGKTQADIDAYFAALPQAQLPASRAITEGVVEEFLHALPRSKAEVLCAAILKRHPQPAAKVEYDRKGYPLNVGPFGLVEFAGSVAFENTHPGIDLEEALIQIEGSNYPALSRVRAVKATERRWPNNKDEDHLSSRAKHMRKWDADMRGYFAQMVVDRGWPGVEEALLVLKDVEARELAEIEKAETAKEALRARQKDEDLC